MLATENWCIKVLDRIYGPYTKDQMATFATEGRISARSLVSPAGSRSWREVRQYPPLAQLLHGEGQGEKTFGKGRGSGKSDKVPEGAEANFVIIFDTTAGTAGRVAELLRSMGSAFRMSDNVWVLSTTQSALGVKNAIAPHLDVREPMFVVDCTRGRTSWQNFVPEIHSKLTKAWVRM